MVHWQSGIVYRSWPWLTGAGVDSWSNQTGCVLCWDFVVMTMRSRHFLWFHLWWEPWVDIFPPLKWTIKKPHNNREGQLPPAFCLSLHLSSLSLVWLLRDNPGLHWHNYFVHVSVPEVRTRSYFQSAVNLESSTRMLQMLLFEHTKTVLEQRSCDTWCLINTLSFYQRGPLFSYSQVLFLTVYVFTFSAFLLLVFVCPCLCTSSGSSVAKKQGKTKLLMWNSIRKGGRKACRDHGLQHARLPWPSLSPGVCANLTPLSWWCHPTISPSVVPFSCLQSFPASGSFPMSWPFTSGHQSIGASASASALLMNIQSWFP